MPKVKVGLLVPLQGPMGVWGPASVQSAILAAAEINHLGGVLGHEIDLIVRDAAWSEDQAAAAAARLIEEDGVSIMVAMVGSNARRAIAGQTAARCPLIYTPNYERGSPEPEVLGISSTDEHLFAPVMDWVSDRIGCRSVFMIGSNYRWPLQTMPAAGLMLRARGVAVQGMLTRPINADDDWDFRALETIRAARPDMVMIFMIGDQAIRFHRNFHAAGLSARIPRLAIATDESVLANLAEAETEGLHAASYYFSSVRSAPNAGFMERYWTAFGAQAPVPGFYGQSCYEGIQVAAGMMTSGRTTVPQALLHARLRDVSFRSARFATPSAHLGLRLPVYIARAEDQRFKVIADYAATAS